MNTKSRLQNVEAENIKLKQEGIMSNDTHIKQLNETISEKDRTLVSMSETMNRAQREKVNRLRVRNLKSGIWREKV